MLFCSLYSYLIYKNLATPSLSLAERLLLQVTALLKRVWGALVSAAWIVLECSNEAERLLSPSSTSTQTFLHSFPPVQVRHHVLFVHHSHKLCDKERRWQGLCACD